MDAWGGEEAPGRAEGLWNEAPGAAAKDTDASIPARPCFSRRFQGLGFVSEAVMPEVLAPLPDIAVNLIQTPRIGFKAFRWNRGLPAYTLFATALIRLASAIIIRLIAGSFKESGL
jgi:hypothetical protein